MIDPSVHINSVSITFDFAEANNVQIVSLPQMPPFTSTAGWKNLTECLRIETGQKFPYGRCRIFSSWLFLFMALNFEGRLDTHWLTLNIEGKEGILIPRRTYHGFERHFTDHYFLELTINGEQWIIDPSWKQFVHAGHFMDQWSVNYSDPFNKNLLEKYPDIIVAKPKDFFVFLKDLSDSISIQNSYTSRKIIHCLPYWQQEGKSHFDEFEKILMDLTSQGQSLEVARNFYCIKDFELFWPILQTACNHPSIPLEQFCAHLLNSRNAKKQGQW